MHNEISQSRTFTCKVQSADLSQTKVDIYYIDSFNDNVPLNASLGDKPTVTFSGQLFRNESGDLQESNVFTRRMESMNYMVTVQFSAYCDSPSLIICRAVMFNFPDLEKKDSLQIKSVHQTLFIFFANL